MDDNFLSQFRKEPRPEFSRTLWEKLNQEKPAREGEMWVAFKKWRLPLAGLSTALLLAVLFSFPGMRAAAQEFLNLFRVKHFAAIKIDPARIEQLRESKIDVKTLLSDNVEVLKKPGEPQTVNNPEIAGQLAGLTVRMPTVLPEGLGQPEIQVVGESALSLTADTAKLRSVLDMLEITDLTVPEQLNGANVLVKVPAAVIIRYPRDRGGIEFIQARSPEIHLPEGVDLAQLGEIGLRIAGLLPDEAHNFAKSIDWHSTLLVPIPANAASFREVGVRGTTGLLITTKRTGGSSERPEPNVRRHGSILLWSEGGLVYAIKGDAHNADLVAMANSIS